jgi:hypothetical protein
LSLYCCSTSYSAGTNSRHTSHLQQTYRQHTVGADSYCMCTTADNCR